MSIINDFLYLRRMPLTYVSPPACEAIFSASGSSVPIVSPWSPLDPPQCPTLTGEYINWPYYTGQFGFLMFSSTTENGAYQSIISFAATNTVSLINPGFYYFTVTTQTGESDPYATFEIVAGMYQQVELPQANAVVNYNLYFSPDGVAPFTKVSAFTGNLVQLKYNLFYKVLAVVPDGETPLSCAIDFTGGVPPSPPASPSNLVAEVIDDEPPV